MSARTWRVVQMRAIVADILKTSVELTTMPDWDYDDSSPKAMRLSVPIQKGHIVKVAAYDGRDGYTVKRALIVEQRPFYSEHRYGWIPEYRAVYERKDGTFGTRLYRVWPGDIGRGYEAVGVAANRPCALCLDTAKAECDAIFRDLGELLSAEKMAAENCTHG